jgi:hypothetical protein
MTVTSHELDAKCQVIEANMDARVEHIENIAEELKKEFKNAKWWAIGAVITVLASFVGIIQLTSSWQQTTVNLIAGNVDSISTKLDSLVLKVDALNIDKDSKVKMR